MGFIPLIESEPCSPWDVVHVDLCGPWNVQFYDEEIKIKKKIWELTAVEAQTGISEIKQMDNKKST